MPSAPTPKLLHHDAFKRRMALTFDEDLVQEMRAYHEALGLDGQGHDTIRFLIRAGLGQGVEQLGPKEMRVEAFRRARRDVYVRVGQFFRQLAAEIDVANATLANDDDDPLSPEL